QTRTGSDCPKFGQAIDSTRSGSDGNFKLQIPGNLSSFVVVYCEPGYLSRTEGFNANAPDGVVVEGNQVILKSLNMSDDDAAAAYTAEVRRLGGLSTYLGVDKPSSPTYRMMRDKLPGVDFDKFVGGLNFATAASIGAGGRGEGPH